MSGSSAGFDILALTGTQSLSTVVASNGDGVPPKLPDGLMTPDANASGRTCAYFTQTPLSKASRSF